jgi:hypothetical protein
VSGVVVSGTWSAGAGGGTCTTDTTGSCTVTASLNKKTSSTTYTVSGLAKSGWVYRPDTNVETSQLVAKP